MSVGRRMGGGVAPQGSDGATVSRGGMVFFGPMAGNPPDAPFAADLALAKAGDGEAVARILERTEHRLRGYVEARLGANLRAAMRHSDVLQNSYLQMLEALPTFDGTTPDDFVAWLTCIIEHDIHRQARWFGAKKRRAPRTSERNVLARILFDPPLRPSAEASFAEEKAIFHKALTALEPQQGEVLRLALIDGLSRREVAERMGRSEGATRMLLMRARAALALELERLADPRSG